MKLMHQSALRRRGKANFSDRILKSPNFSMNPNLTQSEASVAYLSLTTNRRSSAWHLDPPRVVAERGIQWSPSTSCRATSSHGTPARGPTGCHGSRTPGRRIKVVGWDPRAAPAKTAAGTEPWGCSARIKPHQRRPGLTGARSAGRPPGHRVARVSGRRTERRPRARASWHVACLRSPPA